MPRMEAVVLKNGVVDYYSALQVCCHLQLQRSANALFLLCYRFHVHLSVRGIH